MAIQKIPKAYYMTPDSFGWRFIETFPTFWVSEVVDNPKYETDDPKLPRCIIEKNIIA